MKPQVKNVIIKSSVGLTAAALVALCGIYVYALSRVVYYCGIASSIVVAVWYLALDGEKNTHLARTLLVTFVVVAIVIAAYILYYYTGLSAKFNDFEALKSFIVGSGFWGYSIFICLTIFEIVVLPIPSAITILLGVALYGPTVAFILSVIGTMLGSWIAFALGKVFGRRLCNWMFGEQNTDKYAKLVGEKGRFIFIIMLLFPAFPDDMLCMVAGITDMTFLYFTVICILTRPVMIGLTAYLGSGIIPFSGSGIPIWIAIGCLMFVVFLIATRIKNNIENRNGVA
ncbi:MAG: TVP38/TMEM64 family protein [Clostridiales bacterium]|nr:TVP38/TMEM64 family protein [Clostridiales bacterium]